MAAYTKILTRSSTTVLVPDHENLNDNTVDSIPEKDEYPEPCVQRDSLGPAKKDVHVSFEGWVISRKDLSGVAGAEVKIGERIDSTDSGGKYYLPKVRIPLSGVKMRIRHPDYKHWSKNITPRDVGHDLGDVILLRPIFRVVFPPFEFDHGEGSLCSLESNISEVIKQPFVNCTQNIEVLAYTHFPNVVEEIERMKRLALLFDNDQVMKIGRMCRANYLLSAKPIGSGSPSIHIQLTNIDKATPVVLKQLDCQDRDGLLQRAQALGELMIASLASVLITSHRDGDNVYDRIVTLRGINSCIPSGYRLWISVKPHNVDLYYPQCDIDLSGDTWKAGPVYLGAEDTPIGTSYIVDVALANGIANEAFGTYRRQNWQTGENPGMKLPDGARITHRITLIR